MSTHFTTLKNTGRSGNDLDATTFFGGIDKGQMLQLTQGVGFIMENPDEPGFIQLTKHDAERLAHVLMAWVKKIYEN